MQETEGKRERERATYFLVVYCLTISKLYSSFETIIELQKKQHSYLKIRRKKKRRE